MDEIFARRPNEKLLNDVSEIKKYVLFLEEQLETYKISSTLKKKEKKIKRRSTQKELNSLDFQDKESERNDKLLKDIAKLKEEISDLNQRVIKLQNRNDAKTPPAIDNNFRAPKEWSSNDTNDFEHACSVLVEHPLSFTVDIFNMCHLMGIKAVKKDIVKVSNYYQKVALARMTLLVQFRTLEFKAKFMKNRKKLKTHNILKDLDIYEYVSTDVYKLYKYAKVLKDFGYAEVYYSCNKVYAKKSNSRHCKPFLIESESDVDDLLMDEN